MKLRSRFLALVSVLGMTFAVISSAELVPSRAGGTPSTPGPTVQQAQPVAADPGFSEPSRFRLGPTFGLNAGTALCDSCDALGVTGRLGISLGGTFEYLFNEHMALELEIFYLTKGISIRSGGATVGYVDYNTIEFPVSFKGRFGNYRVKGVVFGGPQIGIAVSRGIRAVGGTSSPLNARGIDLGVHVGGGVEFQVTPVVNLFVNGRINIGLADLDLGQIVNEPVHSFGILALGGVKFSL